MGPSDAVLFLRQYIVIPSNFSPVASLRPVELEISFGGIQV
jgi:hypothetical protein